MSIRPLYAADTPARLPISEFIMGLPKMLLPVAFSMCVVLDMIIRLTTLWTWRLALARSSAQVLHLLSLRLSATCILATFALLVAFASWFAGPQGLRGCGGSNGLQEIALLTIVTSLWVLILEMIIACIFGFLPFTLGRIILWCISCFHVGNVDSYTSTASILLIGYGLIFSLGVTFAGGLRTFHQYLRGEPHMIIAFFRRLPGIFSRVIRKLITVCNISLNHVNSGVICPLLLGWLLDIYTAKMFGATMSGRLKLLSTSSFASVDALALHWFIGHTYLNLRLRTRLFKFLRQVWRTEVNIPFLRCDAEENFDEPFYKFCRTKLSLYLIDTIFLALVIPVSIQLAGLLAPMVFPLDITYFTRPTKGTSFWEAAWIGASLWVAPWLIDLQAFSGVHFLRFLACCTLSNLGWLVQKVMQYVGCGDEVPNSVAPKDQYGSTDKTKDRRILVAVRIMLIWLTVVTFYCAVLISAISVGRALLFAVPQLPLSSGLKSNDLFTFAVGYCVISTIIAVCGDTFVYMTSGGPSEGTLKTLFWLIRDVIMPLLIGSLVDLLLISPLIKPADDVSVLEFFSYWELGRGLMESQFSGSVRSTGADASLVDRSWDWEGFASLSVDWRSLPEVLLPVTMKLLFALCFPYAIAKSVFPRFGCSDAVNSAVYRFAWLGSLGFCVLCYLAKVLRGVLHDSIRDERYLIGHMVEDSLDSSPRLEDSSDSDSSPRLEDSSDSDSSP